MKIEELSLGNWVMTPEGPETVASLGQPNGMITTYNGTRKKEFSLFFLAPIPLTEEILKKNHLAGKSFLGTEWGKKISCVHRLQNVIRTLGISYKTIRL